MNSRVETYGLAAAFSLEEAAELIEAGHPDAERLHRAVHENLFVDVVESRQVFSWDQHRVHADFLPALAWLVRSVRVEPGELVIPAAVTKRLEDMARAHRRHGFPAELYSTLASAFGKALRDVGASTTISRRLSSVFTQVCEVMRAAHHAADVAGIPPAYAGRVVAVDKPNRATAVVHVEIGTALECAPGQSVPVTSSLLPGTWREMTPAAPVDATGQLEFHLAAAGDASTSLIRSHPGDWWTLGTPAQDFPAGAGNAEVLVSRSTGWAAHKAHLLALWANVAAGRVPEPARIDVIRLAESPGAFYDTHFQENFAALAPWVRFHHLAESPRDPWLLSPADPAQSLDVTVTDDAAAAITAIAGGRDTHVVGPGITQLASRVGARAADWQPAGFQA